jgi:hypothetical protein
MAGRRGDAAIPQTGTGMGVKRRGILAAAGVVVAGIVAGQQTQVTLAADGDSLLLGHSSNTLTANLAEHATEIRYDGTSTTEGMIFLVQVGATASFPRDANFPAALGGWSGSDSYPNGIFAFTNRSGGYGVVGYTAGSPGAGVYGEAVGASIGVQGTSANSHGVVGTAGTNSGVSGVLGQILGTSSAANTSAVKGNNQGTGASGIGVLGQCDTTTGIGVRGTSNLGTGVSGASNGNTGVFGTTTASGFSALGGIVSTPNTAAFAGTATVPTAFAGFFTGDVFVNGDFTVLDPTRKHGAIAHPDGSYRILYSMESPESWLEDFGTGQLVNGKATVTLDPDFAAVVQTDTYHVFLTMRDAGCQGLAVVTQSGSGFVVQEVRGGASSGGFSYRVVAKPKTTNKATRMAKFVIPDIKVPQPPSMPNVPAATAPDASPQAAPPSRPNPAAAAATVATPPQGSGSVQGGTTSPVQPVPPSRP